MRKWSWLLFVLCFSALPMLGCGDDDDDTADDDTADDDTADDDTAADDDDDDAAVVARGQYLVNTVGGCPACHTPFTPEGTPDTTKFLAGGAPFDIVPGDDTQGLILTRNLTPDPTTGLGNWTDDEIKDAILNGVNKDGEPLFPIMPYYVLHNMSAADADAIVAYLRTLTPIVNEIADRQPLPFPFTTPAAPVPEASIPHTTLATTDANYQAAEKGRYLAGNIGLCMECHTQESAPGTPVPIDAARLFAGNRGFPAADFALPVPPFPEIIYSRNLTPHANGISGWTAEQVKVALKQGLDEEGQDLCPPMGGIVAGPMGLAAGLTDEDALAIGHFLTTIPAIDNGVIPECVPPG